MSVDKIDVKGDTRISHEKADINGHNYHYLLGKPQGSHIGTVVLVHGWPDLSMGWRYQIPALTDLGFQVIVPDMLGYGRSDAPQVPPNNLNEYSLKRAATDLKELANRHGASRIVLGGHDWGGAIVYRVCLWYPDFVTHLFSVCTPFWAPSEEPYVDLETRTNTILPNFKYQVQLASGEVEKHLKDRKSIRNWLNGMYGGRGADGEVVFTTEKGVLFENVPKIGQSPLLSPEESDYYADEYARNGLHGTLNWYRTGKVNHEEEQQLKKRTIDIPTLFVLALNDAALPPWMSTNMGKYIANLTKKEVDASHWALWEKPKEVNNHIKEWLQANGALGSKSTL